MYQQVIDNATEKMKKTTSVYQTELRSIRAGRANPQLLDRVMVDYYGVQTPLNQMGNVSSPEPGCWSSAYGIRRPCRWWKRPF